MTLRNCEDRRPPPPVLAVDDLQVHVDSGDEHLTVDANLVDGGRRQGVGHHHHPHDLIGHRAAVRQSHPDAQTPRDVDHLSGREGGGGSEFNRKGSERGFRHVDHLKTSLFSTLSLY